MQTYNFAQCLLLVASLLSTVIGCSKESMQDPGGTPITGSFHRHRVDETNSGAILNGQSIRKPIELWIIEDLGGEWTSPLIVDNKVYVASSSAAGKPESFTCLDLKSGSKLWGLNIDADFRASPTYYEGVVYVGSHDKQFFAIDVVEKKVKWVVNSPRSFRGSPLIIDDLVILSDWSGIYALNRESGDPVWQKSVVNGTDGSPARMQDHVYFTTVDGDVLCLDYRTGVDIWKMNTGKGIKGSPLVTSDGLYIAHTRGGIFKLNPITGHEIWVQQFDQRLGFGSASIAGDKIYFTCSSTAPTVEPHRVLCLNTISGQFLWEHTLERPNTSDPIIFGDKIFVGDKEGIKRFDRHSGELLDVTKASKRTGGVNTTPAIIGNRMVVTMSSGTVALFEL